MRGCLGANETERRTRRAVGRDGVGWSERGGGVEGVRREIREGKKKREPVEIGSFLHSGCELSVDRMTSGHDRFTGELSHAFLGLGACAIGGWRCP